MNTDELLIEGRRYFWCLGSKDQAVKPVCANPGECTRALIFKVIDGKLVANDKANCGA